MRWAFVVLVLMVVSGPAASAANDEHVPIISDLQPITLKPGINTVPHFAPDGRDALVAYAWRSNGNAWGYHLSLVMLPLHSGGADWNVVGVEPAPGETARFEDTITDRPHTGEDVVRAVRLAHARVDGKLATLLLTADRPVFSPGANARSRLRVNLRVYRLVTAGDKTGGSTGVTADFFQIVRRMGADDRAYCNAELALSRAFKIPLSPDYQGPNKDDGCL